MIILKNPIVNIEKLVGKQSVTKDAHYRALQYVHTLEVDGDIIACNGVTRCMVRLTSEEAKMLSEGVDYCTDAHELIENWFLVPDSHDDYKLCTETRTLLKIFKKPSKNRAYSVMTTLDCNARCFYCFQMGRNKNRIHMPIETANAVADYMIKNSAGGVTDILWFGGEPLYNSAVIDVIIDRLRASGIEYASSMISNGYLLYGDILEKAAGAWRLEKIQITLDGTEKVYNDVKSYIYKDSESPYQVVMNNIGNALEKGILVVIRVNIDRHNKEDVYKLAAELKDRFASYSNFRIYCDTLYENAGTKPAFRVAEERMQLTNDMIDFENYCLDIGLSFPRSVKGQMKTHRCKADSDNSIVISPDGKIGKCDHRVESMTYASLFSSEVDTDMLASFKRELNNKEMCQHCALLHDCYRLENCPEDSILICDDAYKKKKEHRFLMAIKNDYRKICENRKSE